MPKYIVIENPSSKGPTVPEDHMGLSILGLYNTLKEAKQAILEDTQNCWDNADESRWEDCENYASRAIICEVKECYVPVPKVTVDWKMRKLRPDEEQS